VSQNRNPVPQPILSALDAFEAVLRHKIGDQAVHTISDDLRPCGCSLLGCNLRNVRVEAERLLRRLAEAEDTAALYDELARIAEPGAVFHVEPAPWTPSWLPLPRDPQRSEQR